MGDSTGVQYKWWYKSQPSYYQGILKPVKVMVCPPSVWNRRTHTSYEPTGFSLPGGYSESSPEEADIYDSLEEVVELMERDAKEARKAIDKTASDMKKRVTKTLREAKRLLKEEES